MTTNDRTTGRLAGKEMCIRDRSLAPRSALPATRSSSSSTWSVARPATMASWLREKVDEWTTARSIEL